MANQTPRCGLMAIIVLPQRLRGEAAYNDPNYALFNAARDATTAALWLAQAIAEQPELADALGLELETLRGIEAAIEQEMEITADGVCTRRIP